MGGVLTLFSIILISVVSVPVQPSQVFSESPCHILERERTRILALPVAEFDQKPGEGWRIYYERQCFDMAAELLVSYIGSNRSDSYMLRFHAGQMYAMAGQIDEAIAYMSKSYEGRNTEFVDWTAFVDANIAFLRKNSATLKATRKRIAEQTPWPAGPGVPKHYVGKRMNLDVVDGFLACLDKPYLVAYEAPCRDISN